ncbi:MAG TPA: hypothetical protein VMU51_29775 [Mycobacteriales bacterium]|nr:hypothetical protein [Mycobacteriales bacterium]
MRQLEKLARVAVAAGALLVLGVGSAGPAAASGGGGGNPPTGTPVLATVTFAPATVVGGGAATGTITFGSVTDGAIVSLTSSNPAVVSVPTEMIVPGRQSRGFYPVTTSPVAATTAVTITASSFGVTRTGTLTVTPGTPPAADSVRVNSASWSKRLLKISAASSNPNAILSVFGVSSFDGSRFPMFTVTTSLGQFSDQRGWLDNPQNIVVQSNFGGSAASTVRG